MGMVRKASLPDIGQGARAGGNGTPALVQNEESLRVEEAEKLKVLNHQELLMERREQEEILV